MGDMADSIEWFSADYGYDQKDYDYACHIHGRTKAYWMNGRFPTCKKCLEDYHDCVLSGGERE